MHGGISKQVRILTIERGEGRREAEQFIAERFKLMHDARVRHFMPTILCMRDRDGQPIGACGLRGSGPLFLEHYLPQPAETLLAAVCGYSVPRQSIVEVGNLAVAYPGSARALIAALTEYLWATSFDWVVFTGVPALRNAFGRCGIPLRNLGEARLDALPPEHRADWGHYYRDGAQVCAVSVLQAARALHSMGAQAA